MKGRFGHRPFVLYLFPSILGYTLGQAPPMSYPAVAVNRRFFLRTTAGTLAGAGILTTAACPGGPDLSMILDAITIAVDGILPLIPKIPPPLIPVIEMYTGEVTTFIGAAAKELVSGDTALVKAQKIAQLALAIVTPNLSGAPLTLLNEITAIGRAVLDFLQALGVGTNKPALAARATIEKHGMDVKAVLKPAEEQKILTHLLVTKAQLVTAYAKVKPVGEVFFWMYYSPADSPWQRAFYATNA